MDTFKMNNDAVTPVAFVEGYATQSGLLQVCLFDTGTGEYLGTDTVYVSEGCTLMPGQTLDAPLMPPPEDHVFTWDGCAWTATSDYRGIVYHTHSGARIEHLQLGDLPQDLTRQPRPSSLYTWDGNAWMCDLVRLHESKVQEIERDCQAAIGAGFWSEALGDAHYYPSQLDDQLNLTGAILTDIDQPFGCSCENGDRSYRQHTADQLRQVGATFYSVKMGYLFQADALKKRLDQALLDNDQQALEAIHWPTDDVKA